MNEKLEPVKIPEVLIERLRGLGPRFVKVEKKDKSPFEKEWQRPENLMYADDPRLQAYLAEGGNYGVAAGYGLAILNVDCEELKQLVLKKLPRSLTVKSPGHQAPVYYFLSNLTEKRYLRTKNGEYGGEILWNGFQAVGPGSIHPNGLRYEIMIDAPLAIVSEEQLEAALGEYLVPKRETAKVDETARAEKEETGLDLSVLQVVPLAGLKKHGEEYYGVHPVHGSETGRNFWINPRKNAWCCFRHGTGGGPFLWLAVEEGIISCEEAGPGALRGEVFKRVLEKAVQHGYINRSLVGIQTYAGTGTRVGDYWLKKRGSRVFLVDKDNKPVLSCSLASVDGPRFKNKLQEKTGLPEAEIDKATAAFQFALQSIRKSRKNVEKPEEEKLVDAEVVKRAEALLRDPLLLCHVANALRKAGLVGETKNGLLTFLTEVSSKLPDPINLRLSHRASIGKSTIVTKAAMLYPPEDLIIRGGLTKKALYYLPEAEDVDEETRKLVLRGKVLVILEESESQDFLNEAKPLLSHDVPVLKYSFVEEKVTYTVLLEGWPAYIGVTTIPIKGEEHRTRTLLASPDRGKEKYGAVIDDDAERHAFPWLYKSPEFEVFHEVVRRLKPLRVWVPWLPIVSKEFPRNKASSMRDWKKLRTYIEAVAFLHQYQRPHVIIDGVEYIVAIPLDLEIAIKVVEGAMAETVMGLERDVKDFYDFISEKVLTVEETEEALQDKAKKDELKDTFTYKDLMRWYEECFGEPVSKTTLRDRYVEKLEDLGLLEIDESKKTHKISLCSENSAHLANFERALFRVRSEETKAEIIRKNIAKLGGAQKVFFDVFEKYYSYALSNFAILEKLLKRSKSEEYPEKTFFFESVESAVFSDVSPSEASEVEPPLEKEPPQPLIQPVSDIKETLDTRVQTVVSTAVEKVTARRAASPEKKTVTSVTSVTEDEVERNLCDKCGRELGKLREDDAWLCDACYVVSRLKAEWTEDEIIERLVQLGLTPTEAKNFFEDRLAGNLLFWHDKNGKTVWSWA